MVACPRCALEVVALPEDVGAEVPVEDEAEAVVHAQAVAEDAGRVREVQQRLEAQGAPLDWRAVDAKAASAGRAHGD